MKVLSQGHHHAGLHAMPSTAWRHVPAGCSQDKLLTNMTGRVYAGVKVYDTQATACSLPYTKAGPIWGPTRLLPLATGPAILPVHQAYHGIRRRGAMHVCHFLACQVQHTCSMDNLCQPEDMTLKWTIVCLVLIHCLTQPSCISNCAFGRCCVGPMPFFHTIY